MIRANVIVCVAVMMAGIPGCASQTPLLRPGPSADGRPMLSGVVLELTSGRRIPNAAIVVMGTRISTYADDHGLFTLALPDTTAFLLLTNAVGFEGVTRTGHVGPGLRDTMTFRLARSRWPVN